jgi:hypothetical protein
MSQGAISVANGSGLSVRSAINAALARLQSKGSGTGRPADITTYETWIETDNPGSGVVSIWQWDGTTDILLGLFDTVSHAITVTATELAGDTVTADAYTNTASSVVALTSTSPSLADAHNGKTVTLTNAGAITLTVPNTLVDGFSCMLVQGGAGQVTVTAGSGVTFWARNGAKLAGNKAAAALSWIAADTYLLAGDVTT